MQNDPLQLGNSTVYSSNKSDHMQLGNSSNKSDHMQLGNSSDKSDPPLLKGQHMKMSSYRNEVVYA